MTGEVVSEFVKNEKINKGVYKKSIRFRNVPTGIYIIQINLNEDSTALLVPNCN